MKNYPCNALLLAGLLCCSPAFAQTVGAICNNPRGSVETTKSSTVSQGILVCTTTVSGGEAWEPIGQGLPSYDQSSTCANVGQFRYNTSTNAPQYCNASGVWTSFTASAEFQANKVAGTGSSFCTAATDASANPYIIQGHQTWLGTIYFYQDSHHAVLCNLTGAGLSIVDQYGTSELYPWQ